MRVTFIIGNGFDIHIGLNSRYSDFYPYFIDNASDKNVIRKWMTNEDITLWSDMELWLGKSLEKLDASAKELFYSSRTELEDLLCKYLYKEQLKFSIVGNENKYSKEMVRSVLGFADSLSQSDKNTIKRIIELHLNEQTEYMFVSLNFTDCLDRIVNYTIKRNPINKHYFNGQNKDEILYSVFHLHGTLDNGIIMGVNDEKQIANDKLCLDPEFLSVFLKERLNDNLGELRNEGLNSIINNSTIIAIYGASIGETDNYLWEIIYQRMLDDTDTILIIYHFENTNRFQKKNSQQMVMIKSKIKKQFRERVKSVSKDTDMASVMNRIFISFNNDLFSFK